jgi:hypothetical protein
MSKGAPHWTDGQLINALYGVGPEGGHLEECPKCRGRLAALRMNRKALELETGESRVDFDFLAAQRRRIYQKLEQPIRWWSHQVWKKWAPAVFTVVVLAGGIAVYQEKQHFQKPGSELSDVQLAQEASRMSQEYEAQSTAPLQGLFE